MELRWCAERGIPHSQFLAWPLDDRVKVMAWLMEEAERCQMCGTAAWEWEEDPRGFAPSVHVCRGCALREQSKEMASNVPGGTVVLVTGKAKEAELAKQREEYQAQRRKE